MNFCVNFDLDGTLIRSMELNLLSWNKTLEDKNIKIKKEDYFVNEGLKGKDLINYFTKKYDFKIKNYQSAWDKKDEYFMKNYKFSLYPNALRLLMRLKRKH